MKGNGDGQDFRAARPPFLIQSVERIGAFLGPVLAFVVLYGHHRDFMHSSV